MIVIRHRVNSRLDLKNTSPHFGVEVDIRSDESGLYLSHDPFTKGELLSDWLGNFKHAVLVVNVKEDGLEDRVVEMLKDSNVSSYFFLDQAMPTIIRRGLAGLFDSALRFSEYESIESIVKMQDFSSWVWVDSFHRSSIHRIQLERLKLTGLRVCLVSPELHGPNRLPEAAELKETLKGSYHLIDAVCTKFPEMWTQR